MNLKKFSVELKRRKVYTVAIAYLVGGWALAQGISQLAPVFDIPTHSYSPGFSISPATGSCARPT
ncbi:MAG: hypothetical protein DMF29_00890 [Verrucomicrobia bacterium]|nr:MAG: hypothetical protein DMF29_00890 [Verrucomicrobiota bacterium]